MGSQLITLVLLFLFGQAFCADYLFGGGHYVETLAFPPGILYSDSYEARNNVAARRNRLGNQLGAFDFSGNSGVSDDSESLLKQEVIFPEIVQKYDLEHVVSDTGASKSNARDEASKIISDTRSNLPHFGDLSVNWEELGQQGKVVAPLEKLIVDLRSSITNTRSRIEDQMKELGFSIGTHGIDILGIDERITQSDSDIRGGSANSKSGVSKNNDQSRGVQGLRNAQRLDVENDKIARSERRENVPGVHQANKDAQKKTVDHDTYDQGKPRGNDLLYTDSDASFDKGIEDNGIEEFPTVNDVDKLDNVGNNQRMTTSSRPVKTARKEDIFGRSSVQSDNQDPFATTRFSTVNNVDDNSGRFYSTDRSTDTNRLNRIGYSPFRSTLANRVDLFPERKQERSNQFHRTGFSTFGSSNPFAATSRSSDTNWPNFSNRVNNVRFKRSVDSSEFDALEDNTSNDANGVPQNSVRVDSVIDPGNHDEKTKNPTRTKRSANPYGSPNLLDDISNMNEQIMKNVKDNLQKTQDDIQNQMQHQFGLSGRSNFGLSRDWSQNLQKSIEANVSEAVEKARAAVKAEVDKCRRRAEKSGKWKPGTSATIRCITRSPGNGGGQKVVEFQVGSSYGNSEDYSSVSVNDNRWYHSIHSDDDEVYVEVFGAGY